MEKGITHLKHIYHNDSFMSLQQLIQKCDIRSTQFLQYQQLRSVICPKINSKTLDLPIPISEFINITTTKKLLSKIHQIITEVYTGDYNGKYTGDIDPRDIDDMMLKEGRFHQYSEIKDILRFEHKRAVLNYLFVNEAKTLVEVDKEGNVIINNPKLNYQKEYDKAHKLLLTYETTDNIEGMKYEISKLWYINHKLESKINGKSIDERKGYVDIRARVLNDFNKYVKYISTKDNTNQSGNPPFLTSA